MIKLSVNDKYSFNLKRVNYIIRTAVLTAGVLIIPIISGCAGGSSGISSGTTSTTGTGGGGTTNQTSTNQSVLTGWSSLDSQSWTDAQSNFQSVIDDSSSSSEDKMQAYSGLGWVSVKKDGGFYDSNGQFKSDIITNFATASSTLEDAKVGLSLAYLHRNASAADSTSAKTLLESVLQDETFSVVHDVGINLSDVWLLLAIARMESGDSDGASTALQKAKQLGSSADDTIFQNISTALETLL